MVRTLSTRTFDGGNKKEIWEYLQEPLWPVKYLFSDQTLREIANMRIDNLILWNAWGNGRVKAWDLYGDGQCLLQCWKLRKGGEIVLESTKLKGDRKGLRELDQRLLTTTKKT